MTERTFTFSVVSSSTPSWWAAITQGTWGTVATSGTISAVVPTSPGGAGPAAVANAWTGGSVDQVRGEYLLAANGGHGDYAGNEVYSLNLKAATPAWARLTDPTPAGQILSTSVGGALALNSDGKPRAVHGWHRACFGNDRVWYAGQDSYVSGGGDYGPGVVAFNRTSLAWETYGTLTGSPTVGSTGPAVYDSKRSTVWSIQGQDYRAGIFGVDATTGVDTYYNDSYENSQNGSLIAEGTWAVYAPDPVDLVIFGNSFTSVYPDTVGAWNPATQIITRYSVDGASTWAATARSGAAMTPAGPGLGAVYDTANKCIYVSDLGSSLAGTIKILELPTSLGGTASAFQWTTYTPPSGVSSFTTDADYRGAYSKFNIVNDVGGGKRALVCVVNITGPTYVMPLPDAGLTGS